MLGVLLFNDWSVLNLNQQTEYRKRGYGEVMTPNMYNSELWKTSGHWQQ